MFLMAPRRTCSKVARCCWIMFYRYRTTVLQRPSSEYHQTSNISCTLGNKIFDHSDVVGTSPARDEKHLIWCNLYYRFDVVIHCTINLTLDLALLLQYDHTSNSVATTSHSTAVASTSSSHATSNSSVNSGLGLNSTTTTAATAISMATGTMKSMALPHTSRLLLNGIRRFFDSAVVLAGVACCLICTALGPVWWLRSLIRYGNCSLLERIFVAVHW